MGENNDVQLLGPGVPAQVTRSACGSQCPFPGSWDEELDLDICQSKLTFNKITWERAGAYFHD